MKPIVGYARVSTSEQAANGISIDAQRDMLKAYARNKNVEIRIFEDAGFSAKDTNRPAFQRMMQELRRGIYGEIVIWKLDRFSRNLRDTLSIIEDVLLPSGISLVSLTEHIDTGTPAGRLAVNMLSSMGQMEREQDSDRVVMALKFMAKDCKYTGGHVPVGYCVDDSHHYHLDPVTAPIIRHIFEMYMARQGYAEILAYLNSPEIFPLIRKGKPYTKQDLYFIFKNEFYAGIFIRRFGSDKRHRITYPETIRIPGGVPAIVTEQEWVRICAIREVNSANYASSYRAKNVYPLSGLVYCAVCGSRMTVRHGGKERSGVVERYYICPNRCITFPRIHHVEGSVFMTFESLASDDEFIRQACENANRLIDEDSAVNQSTVHTLESRLQEIARQTSRLISFIKDHEHAPSSMMNELEALDHEDKSIRNKITALQAANSKYDPKDLKRLLSNVAGIRKLPPEEQRTHIQATVSKVLVSQDNFTVRFACPTCGGDEAPYYVEHTLSRKAVIKSI